MTNTQELYTRLTINGVEYDLVPRRPIQPITYIRGGIIFERTGEYRTPANGEWFLIDEQKPRLCEHTHTGLKRDILRPKEIIRDENV